MNDQGWRSRVVLVLMLVCGRLDAADRPATGSIVTEVRGSFSTIKIPTPAGFTPVSKVDPLLKQLWEGNLTEPKKLSVYISLGDKKSVVGGRAPRLLHHAFVATNPNFGNLFYNHKDFEAVKDGVRSMVKNATKGGLESVVELAKAQRELTTPIADVTMVVSSFGSERILLFLMVASEPDGADKNSPPLRFGKACAFVNVRGNLVCCYMLGNATDLVELESACYKWSEEVVHENPSTVTERLQEASPFHSAFSP